MNFTNKKGQLKKRYDWINIDKQESFTLPVNKTFSEQMRKARARAYTHKNTVSEV